MGQYGRKVLKRHEKVLTASSDIGMSFILLASSVIFDHDGQIYHIVQTALLCNAN